MIGRLRQRHGFTLFDGFQVGAVIYSVNRPTMLIGKINDAGKRSILKAKPHARWVNMGGNSDDRIHQLVEKPAMGDDQVTTRSSAHKIVQCLTRAQEQSPI